MFDYHFITEAILYGAVYNNCFSTFLINHPQGLKYIARINIHLKKTISAKLRPNINYFEHSKSALYNT